MKKGQEIKCRRCGSFNYIKHGITLVLSGSKQRYQCKDCGYTFVHTLESKNLSDETKAKIRSSKLGSKNPMWKGDKSLPSTARERARRLYGHLCPEGMEIHHIDGNPWNNERENIEFVERRTHMIKDDRRRKLIERNKKGRGSNHPRWQGDSASKSAIRSRRYRERKRMKILDKFVTEAFT